MSSPTAPLTPQPPEIVGLRPTLTGVYVAIRCRACNTTFEGVQPTLAGVPLGRHVCPRCQAIYNIAPDDFEAALDRHIPARSLEEVVRLVQEATRVAEGWHRAEPLAELLSYHGVGLGAPTERELLALLTSALLAADRARNGAL